MEIKELQRTKFAPGGGERRSVRIRITEKYRFVPDDTTTPTIESLVEQSGTKRKNEQEEEEGQVKRIRMETEESPSVEEPQPTSLMSFVRGIIDILLSLLERPAQFVFLIILVRSLSLSLLPINRKISLLDHSNNYSVCVHQQADLLSEWVREET